MDGGDFILDGLNHRLVCYGMRLGWRNEDDAASFEGGGLIFFFKRVSPRVVEEEFFFAVVVTDDDATVTHCSKNAWFKRNIDGAFLVEGGADFGQDVLEELLIVFPI